MTEMNNSGPVGIRPDISQSLEASRGGSNPPALAEQKAHGRSEDMAKTETLLLASVGEVKQLDDITPDHCLGNLHATVWTV
jgi:hypothetical protein